LLYAVFYEHGVRRDKDSAERYSLYTEKVVTEQTSLAYECFSALLDIPGHSLHDSYDKFRCIHKQNTMLQGALDAVVQTTLYRSNDNYLPRPRQGLSSTGGVKLARAVHFPSSWTLSFCSHAVKQSLVMRLSWSNYRMAHSNSMQHRGNRASETGPCAFHKQAGLHAHSQKAMPEVIYIQSEYCGGEATVVLG